jgi:hypothetical protein
MRLLSWNVHQLDLWDELAGDGAALALLQEAPLPPTSSTRQPLEVIPAAGPAWSTAGWERRPWRTAIARLSPEISLSPVPDGDMSCDSRTLRVSRAGTLVAATVVRRDQPLFVAASVYAPWERPLAGDRPIWADASAHRLLSDLTPLLWRRGLPVVVTGDWNILRGYGEGGDHYYGQRFRSVFDRAEALGLRFVGPEHPRGRQADPWPDELPSGSTCVPTYYHGEQTPATATRQLDFVFASASLAQRIEVTALNDPGEWGPSDHCRLRIDVDV